MKRKSNLGAASVILVLLTSCSLLPRANGQPPAPQPVAITVAVQDGTTAGTCQIVQPTATTQTSVSQHSAVITWTIQGNDYKFDTNGIEFVDRKPGMATKPIPAGQFTKQNSSDTTWVVRDVNLEAGSFGYDIAVSGRSNGRSCKLDPTILNDGTCPPEGC